MEITRFVVNMIQENCYLIYDESKEAAIIDCGAFFPEERESIDKCITDKCLCLKRMLNTHGHFDHVFGSFHIYEKYGLKMELCEDEKDNYEHGADLMKKVMCCDFPLQTAPIGNCFKDGDELSVGNIRLEVISTPGHTPGGVCFYCEKERVLFSGDSLFRHEIGRCDLPGGSEYALVNALKTRILTLPDEVKVLPGHGEPTTIGEERRSNPYLR